MEHSEIRDHAANTHIAATVRGIAFREPTAGRARSCVAVPDSAALHPGGVPVT